MKIRNAEISDIFQIMQIERQSFSPSICESQNVFEERIKLCKNCFLVFENDDGKLSGYFSAERWQNICLNEKAFALGHSANSHCPDGKILYLSSFAILPEFRGTGQGKLFFKKSVDFFCRKNSGIETIVLAVNENWKNAVRIYEADGFKQIARFDNFFHEENSETENEKSSATEFSAALIMAKDCG